MGHGSWLVWMAAPWMWRTRRRTTKPSVGQEPAADRVPIPRVVSWVCWRVEPTCCGRRVWASMRWVRSSSPPRLCRRCARGCCVWQTAARTGADLLWRVRQNARLEVDNRLADGSYLSRIYSSTSHRRNQRRAIVVRVMEYRLKDVPGAEKIYRLITTILDPKLAPAKELAALYHERWEIETTLDELKTHLRGAQIVLRSKTPELVKQEFYGLLMAHFAIRGLMHEAALEADEDPDRLSFVHAVHVVQRRLPRYVATPPSAEEHLS